MQVTAANIVRVREAERGVRKLSETECEGGEFRNKIKQKQNEIKQPKYEKRQIKVQLHLRRHESVWQGVGIAPLIVLLGTTRKGVSSFTPKPL
jgi:hypothetical protein